MGQYDQGLMYILSSSKENTKFFKTEKSLYQLRALEMIGLYKSSVRIGACTQCIKGGKPRNEDLSWLSTDTWIKTLPVGQNVPV